MPDVFTFVKKYMHVLFVHVGNKYFRSPREKSKPSQLRDWQKRARTFFYIYLLAFNAKHLIGQVIQIR